MFALVTWITVNWYYEVAVALSFMAAIGFLTFLRGFLLGYGQVVYINVHAEHLGEAQLRAVRGMVIMLNAFVWWVLFKAILALFGQASVNVPLTLWILIPYGLIVLYLWLKSGKKGGHH